jgi:hypothetical protein
MLCECGLVAFHPARPDVAAQATVARIESLTLLYFSKTFRKLVVIALGGVSLPGASYVPCTKLGWQHARVCRVFNASC